MTVKSLYARSTALHASIRRVAVVLFSAVTVIGVFSAPAQAGSFSSSLSGVGPNFESNRWSESSSATTTTIKFTGCSSDLSSVNVTLAKDINNLPDSYYVRASFTQCFASSTSVSTGNWSDHGAGKYYFIVNDGGVGGSRVSVKKTVASW
ncbi:hypothetical protein [Streptomyces sp. NBC_00304]|uniref:hypothetical protein n=1 Tax=Streptomyces sp. NBC_00304 TaxID=2975706 RepID=UPI002E27BA9C|nr:hypothetical protein [Streptomyces sp. NBC_00304]